MTKLTENVFAVEVPSDAFNLCVSENNELGYYANIEYFDKMHYDPLPPGSWQLLCTTREASEEQAKGVVEYDKFIEGYKDYDTDNFHHDTPFIKALDSLRSLLASKGLDLNQNYCLLKKM